MDLSAELPSIIVVANLGGTYKKLVSVWIVLFAYKFFHRYYIYEVHQYP